jgi:predicted permease
MGLTLPAPDQPGGAVKAQAVVRIVSPDYFAALNVRVLAGRGFSDDDTLAAPPVAVVNRTFAERYLGGSPLERDLPLGAEDQPGARVVGILDDIRQRSATDPHQAEIYLCALQREGGYRPPQAYLVVRTDGRPAELVPALRGIVREADDGLAVESVMTMETRVLESLARPRLYALLLGAFAVVAVTIAGAGLFGVLSYSVARRTREIGVRSALGARPVDIVRLVLRQGLLITAAGLVLGTLASAWLVQLLESLLFGVPPHDLPSFVAVVVGLLALALLACAIPALRAARIDPQQVLRGN